MIKISVPNGRDIKRKLAVFDWTAGKGEKDSLNPVAPLEHINCFSYQSIARMAHIVGLEEVDVRTRSRKNQRLSELTLRDLVYPAYRWLLQAKYGHGAGSTYLFFQSR